MNWLAARLCRFRSEAEKEPLSRPYGTLHAAKQPYMAAPAALTRRDSVFTRGSAALHVPTGLYVPLYALL